MVSQHAAAAPVLGETSTHRVSLWANCPECKKRVSTALIGNDVSLVETGFTGLYAGLGFRPIPPYYANPLPDVVYLGLDLTE